MRNSHHSTGRGSVIEILESRRLLSASPVHAGAISPQLVIVGPITAPTAQTLILHEHAGVQFTASLGTFTTIAPATNLQAAITWGDGTTSQGTLKPISVVGLDQIKFEVDGTHTYTKVGRYPIRVTVTQPGPTPTSLVRLIATLHDRALVSRQAATLLDGTIKGRYSLAPTAADLGGGYVFNGLGTAGDLGAVSAHAFVTTPGLVTTGQATGTLTLTETGPSASAVLNSVTLKLTGPTEPGFGPFPATLAYTITGGTGAFAGATGAGSIAVTLNTDMTFSFVITSVSPV